MSERASRAAAAEHSDCEVIGTAQLPDASWWYTAGTVVVSTWKGNNVWMRSRRLAGKLQKPVLVRACMCEWQDSDGRRERVGHSKSDATWKTRSQRTGSWLRGYTWRCGCCFDDAAAVVGATSSNPSAGAACLRRRSGAAPVIIVIIAIDVLDIVACFNSAAAVGTLDLDVIVGRARFRCCEAGAPVLAPDVAIAPAAACAAHAVLHTHLRQHRAATA